MVALYILLGSLGLFVVYVILLNLYKHTKVVLHELKMLALDRETRQRILHTPDRIYPDASGAYPMLQEPCGGRVLDADRGLVYNRDGLLTASPEVHKAAALRRIVQSLQVNIGSEAATRMLEAPAPQPVSLPAEIPLRSILTEPDIKSLVLGQTINGDGQAETVRADMGKLVHIAVGGSSGWGKSVFLRALAYQLALSRTPTDLAMIDLEGATLAPFARCGRLLYPIAENEVDALAVLKALEDELERRKGLYARYPGVDCLDAYNAQADESLVPLVAVVDEATALLGDKSVEGTLRTLALRARKYGLWLIMAGQDWKANSLDTAIRNQLSSRIQFKAMGDGQSRVLLGQSGAEKLDAIGRAMAILPGREMITMQAPFISARTIMADVSDGGAQYPMPEIAGELDAEALEKRVKALYDEGVSLRGIAEAIYGYYNGRKGTEIKNILGLV